MEVYFRARGDYRVVHEPFADAYWKGTSAPDKLEHLLDLSESNDLPLFAKDIAHHIPQQILADGRLINSFSHVILIRSPLAAFHSHLKVNPEVKDHEFGYEALYKVFQLITEITGKHPQILQADRLLADAESTIKNFCGDAGIPHLPEALSWKPKSHSEWQAADKWQTKAGASHGFEQMAKSQLPALPKRLQEVFKLHEANYHRLLAAASSKN